MTILIAILQLVISLAYVSFIYKRYGVLTSISASTYSLKGQERWYFLAFLWSIALLNLAHPMGLYGFITTAGLCFTGITIDHEDDIAHSKQVHMVATVGAIICAFLGLVILHSLWWSTISFIIGSIALIKHPKAIWYIEILAISLICVSYMTL